MPRCHPSLLSSWCQSSLCCWPLSSVDVVSVGRTAASPSAPRSPAAALSSTHTTSMTDSELVCHIHEDKATDV